MSSTFVMRGFMRDDHDALLAGALGTGSHASGSVGTTHGASISCAMSSSMTWICCAESVLAGPLTAVVAGFLGELERPAHGAGTWVGHVMTTVAIVYFLSPAAAARVPVCAATPELATNSRTAINEGDLFHVLSSCLFGCYITADLLEVCMRIGNSVVISSLR